MPTFTNKDVKPKGLIKSEKLKKCMMCDNLIEYIDYCAEARVCSHECQSEFDKLVTQQEKLFFESEEWLNFMKR